MRGDAFVNRRSLARWGPAIAWAAVLFGLSSVPGRVYPRVSLTFADKLVHIAVYAVFGWLCARALLWTKRARPRWRTLVAAVALASSYGISDEVHQWFVPGRSADWRDVVADAIGAALGAALLLLTARPGRYPAEPDREANRLD